MEGPGPEGPEGLKAPGRTPAWTAAAKVNPREAAAVKAAVSTWEAVSPECGILSHTNLKFNNVKSKKMQDHLEALQSRCHFLDLTLDTMRDKFLRIKQIFRQGQLFKDYDFSEEKGAEILEFMSENKDKLREMSLRMALKLADLTKVSEENWKALAQSTCMKNN